MGIEKFQSVTTSFLPGFDIPNVDALGKDFATASSGSAPLTFGMFRMNKGEALPYTYEFDEFKLVLEGEITVTDDTGAVHKFKAGDVMQFGKDMKVTFSSPSTGLAFFVAQR